ncbi:MAG: DnrP protein [Gammaproteobacteria bacterium]|nr:MAG: DnrP protein [Gammaproteobacteria bacterium]
MSHLRCKHCSGDVTEGDKICPNCGIPLPPNLGQERQRRFLVWFVLIVLFCIFMIIWLPPDWSSFITEPQ